MKTDPRRSYRQPSRFRSLNNANPCDHPDYDNDVDDDNTYKCAQCGTRKDRFHMVRHHPSDLLICKTCIPAFVLELCDGDEINPTFEDANGDTIRPAKP